ncbi:hypothetical protein [Pseudomonas sp. nanlin1]|uniref:hypothetical protein n=1 Tax=Pseudomonas sp. nanlin1 TaxID=3040605 RepID=UPI00388DA438
MSSTPSSTATSMPIASQEPTWKSALKALNENKWWFAPLAIISSIMLFARYLWAVGHPELLLSVIGSPSALFVWLAFAVLGFFLLYLTLSIPTVFFIFSMQTASPDEHHRADVARGLAAIVMIAFVALMAYILFIPSQLSHPWIAIIGLALISALGIAVLSRQTSAAGKAVFRKAPVDGIDPWGYKWDRVIGVGCLAWTTSMVGLFPAQIILLTWRGAEEGLMAMLEVGGYFILLMSSSLVAPLVFFISNKPFDTRLRYAMRALAGVMIINVILLPSVFDLGVFSGAHLLKIRDPRPFEYTLDKKDYPKSLFPYTQWKTTPLIDDTELYKVFAFRQFQFGDILLLCPGQHASVKLKYVETYAEVCVSITASKVRFSEIAKKLSISMPAAECLVPAPVQTQIPRPISRQRKCAIGL